MIYIYRCLINLFFPIILIIIFFRMLCKKEDKQRYKEKIFYTSSNFKRDKNKKLIWFHVASIGELKSIITLINFLNKQDKFQFLITTVTLSSSLLFQKEFSNEKNIFHKFFPIDKMSLVKKFMNDISPNFAIFIDSEIWPNFIFEIKKRNIPLILLNARISKKTFLKWNLINEFSKKVFQSFDLCLTSNNETKQFLKEFDVKNIKFFGNLKFTLQNNDSRSLTHTIKKSDLKKKYWCAMSTHEGEDIFCLNTHQNIKKIHNDIVSIIIPRHINRVKKINAICKKFSLNSQIISNDETIDPNKEIIIINSYGVASKYLGLCKSVFIGKSMIKKLKQAGGQNPIEAAKLGCKIYHGPFVYNFNEIYELLNKHAISEKIFDSKDLAKKLTNDLNNTNTSKKENIELINNLGRNILDETTRELNKIINK